MDEGPGGLSTVVACNACRGLTLANMGRENVTLLACFLSTDQWALGTGCRSLHPTQRPPGFFAVLVFVFVALQTTITRRTHTFLRLLTLPGVIGATIL